MEEKACPGCGSCAGMFTANSMACMAEAVGPKTRAIMMAHTMGVPFDLDAATAYVEAYVRFVHLVVGVFDAATEADE